MKRLFVVLCLFSSGGLLANSFAKVPPPMAAKNGFAPVLVDGTPHDEESTSITIHWAKTQLVSALGTPGATGSPATRFTAVVGERVKYDRSVMLIEAPTVGHAVKAMVLSGWDYDLKKQTTGATVSIKLAAGDAVFVLKYQGEGTCIIQHSGRTYYANCPGAGSAAFSGFEGGWKPKAATWWIHIGGGWIEVDARFKVTVKGP